METSVEIRLLGPLALQRGAELTPVDFSKLYTPGPAGYTDYPTLAA